ALRWRSRVTRLGSAAPRVASAWWVSAAIRSAKPAPVSADIWNPPGVPGAAPARSILLRTGQTGAGPVGGDAPAPSAVRGPPHPPVGARPARAAPPHPFPLHRIVALANARSVQQGHRIAVEVEVHLDHVPGRAGVRRDDRHVAAGDAVEQARFAGVGR